MKHSKNKNQRICTLISTLIVISLIVSGMSIAQPPLPPNAFQGKVFINGEAASEVEIKAYIDGELRGTTYTDSKGVYGKNFDYLLVDGDENDDGKTITFTVNGIASTNITVWHTMSPPRTFNIYVWKNKGSGGTSGGGGTTSSGNIGGNMNNPPIAKITVSLTAAMVGQEIAFDASDSYDPDNDTLTYTWNFGDGATAEGVKVTHSYSSVGTYIVSLTVKDGRGGEDTVYQTIDVIKGNYPPSKPTIDGPTEGHTNISYEYTFTSTDPDNDAISYTINWGDGNQDTTDFLSSGSTVSREHSWSQPGKYTIQATASDNETTSQTATLTVLIDAKNVGDIGYLIDENGDGIYDKFHSNTGKEAEVQKLDNGSYLIDKNNDGIWDYYYTPDTDTLSTYASSNGEEKPSAGVSASLIILVVIIVIIFIGLAYLSMKRGKSKPSASTTKKDVQKTKSSKKK